MCVFARFVLAQLRAVRASSTAKRKGLATQLLGFGMRRRLVEHRRQRGQELHENRNGHFIYGDGGFVITA
jgi:hypothetical protein